MPPLSTAKFLPVTWRDLFHDPKKETGRKIEPRFLFQGQDMVSSLHVLDLMSLQENVLFFQEAFPDYRASTREQHPSAGSGHLGVPYHCDIPMG